MAYFKDRPGKFLVPSVFFAFISENAEASPEVIYLAFSSLHKLFPMVADDVLSEAVNEVGFAPFNIIRYLKQRGIETFIEYK